MSSDDADCQDDMVGKGEQNRVQTFNRGLVAAIISHIGDDSVVWLSENEEDILDNLNPPGGPGSLVPAENDISQISILVRWIIAFILYLRNVYKISKQVSVSY